MTKKRQFCPRGHDAFQAGRDASKRCLQCNAEDAAAKAALAEQAVAEEHAALERRREEIDRRLEQEYQAAIKRGGYDAAMARWDKAYGETNDAYGGRYGLCQWEDEVDGEFIGRMCYRRTTGVYCHMHDRQLERESERKRKAKERETAPPADPKPRPSRRREGSSARPRGRRCITNGCREWAVPNGSSCARHNTSGWAAYKTKHPARAAFYASSTWRSMRDRQLRYYPTCVVCGEKASHADHVLAIANGGTTDGRLQSMCRQAPPREDRPGQPRGRQAGGRKTKGEAAMNRTTFSSFGRRKKRPSKPFIHQEGCKIAEVDPGVEIPWSYLGDGFWKAECVCGFETFTEPLIDDRVRLDPLDPRTGRHLGQCEYVSETDSAVLKVLLKVKPGMGEGYDWVECNGCDMGWQVAHFAESVG